MHDHEFVDVVCAIPLSRSLTYRMTEKTRCTVGQRVTVPLSSRKLTGYVIATHSDAPKGNFTIKEIHRVIDTEPIFSQSEIDLARWMSSFYACSLGEALSVMLPGGKRDAAAAALDPDDLVSPVARDLSVAQQEAIQSITSREHRMYYLFGVTGSGKTEVFLQAAREEILKGGQVIYLVPEISLTHQLSREVSRRFPEGVAILHSAMTGSQRLREWNRIRKGEVSLVIGARSAVFAPVARASLIIIDEEHENSYKSGSHPRYHARQVALRRVQDASGVLVMGSATPSLEAWKLMEDRVMQRLVLPKRISGGTMPSIEVVDLSEYEGPLSKPLRKAIHEVLGRKKQVILFLNRRGFSYFFHCKSCGFEMQCPHCSVSMTYHRSSNELRCHYCGYSHLPHQVCPTCGSLDVGYSGYGTELVESEVARVFPHARTIRIDTDTVKEKQHLQKALRTMRDGEADILLGTQMVAKGLNFPGVELVGIVLADSALHLPDFRSQERTFALLTQVAGRSGRFSNTGRVIIQTYHPANSAIAHAVDQDLEAFYSQELKVRSELDFPPFSRICRIVFRSRSQSRSEAAADKALSMLEQRGIAAAGVQVLGPAPCPIERIARNWRNQIILRSKRVPPLLRAAVMVRELGNTFPGVYIEIDLDPLSLL